MIICALILPVIKQFLLLSRLNGTKYTKKPSGRDRIAVGGGGFHGPCPHREWWLHDRRRHRHWLAWMPRHGHHRHCHHWRWRRLPWSSSSSRVVASMIVVSSSLVGVDALPLSPLLLSSLVVVVASGVLVLVVGSGILDRHRHRWGVVLVAAAIAVVVVAGGCLPR